jgi:hypothetical protein
MAMMTASSRVTDLAGAEWLVWRQWFSRRPRCHRRDELAAARALRPQWEAADLLLLPLVLLRLPDMIAGGVVIGGVVLGALVVGPSWAIAALTGWSWPIAAAVWVAAIVVVTVCHPILRVPFRRPWVVVALRADQGWADRSAWSVRGWRKSREAVTAIAGSIAAGRGPQLPSAPPR